MRVERVVFESRGVNLIGVLTHPDGGKGPVVVMCHGLSNSKEDCPLISETSDLLVRNGLATFRFDYFGSGESPGRMVDKSIDVLLANTRDAIAFVELQGVATSIGLWGRSFGGTLAGLCANDNNVAASVIASGVFFLDRVFHRDALLNLIRREAIKEQRGEKLPGTGNYKGPYGLSNGWYEECLRYGPRLSDALSHATRVMVLGTSPDEKVPPENSLAIYDLVEEPEELHIFSGVNHAYEGVEHMACSLAKRWFIMHLR